MVREAHLSSDCPSLPAYRDSFLGDEFDSGWEEDEGPPSVKKSKEQQTDRRNLAGVVTKPVAAKSRRRSRGRRAKVDSPASARGRQISVFLALADWQLLRDEAARQRTSMSELCRQWLRPHLERLCEKHDDCTNNL